MSSLLGYAGNISGTTGATNVLEPKSSWKVYIFPQGAHATASSTGTVITLGSTGAYDSAAGLSAQYRFPHN